jgi:importin subunit beta-1
LTGLRKFDQSVEDENLDEMPENSLTLAAGYTLENISRVVRNFIIPPLLNFIQPRIGSDKWGDRYISLIAFGSIIDGPEEQQFNAAIGEFYSGFVNMIHDPVPKVRQTAAFVLYKMAEFLPNMILSISQENLDLFVNNCLLHMTEHHQIATLVMGALRNLMISGSRLGVAHNLNGHFLMIF